MKSYPLLDVRVSTPTLELRAATDELLDQLAEVVRAGKTHAEPAPYDDPMSFYEPDPDLRVAKWLRAIWRSRGKVEPDAWRLYFVVMVDGRPVGEQTLTGVNFSTLGTVTTFSWLSADQRGRGLGHEMRAAILHLAFDGLGSKQATSDAFADNHGSNAISRGSPGSARNSAIPRCQRPDQCVPLGTRAAHKYELPSGLPPDCCDFVVGAWRARAVDRRVQQDDDPAFTRIVMED